MRKIPLVEGEYYHLYNRGVDKRKIFTSHAEYIRFLAYLHLLNDSTSVSPSNFFRTHKSEEAFTAKQANPLVAIGAFCLMPNHFHLYITPLVEGGISKFMQRLELAYTKYFNKKHGRAGSLFGTTFQSQHITNENQAKYLFSYIHLNPAKLKDKNWRTEASKDWRALKKFVENYSYSSYEEYASKNNLITKPEYFPNYFQSEKDLTNHIRDWLNYSEDSEQN